MASAEGSMSHCSLSIAVQPSLSIVSLVTNVVHHLTAGGCFVQNTKIFRRLKTTLKAPSTQTPTFQLQSSGPI